MFINSPNDDVLDEIPPDSADDDFDEDTDEGIDPELDVDPSSLDDQETTTDKPAAPAKPAVAAQKPAATNAEQPAVEPELTPEQLKAEYEALKGYKQLNERFGAVEGIQPAIELMDSLTTDPKAENILDLLKVINPDVIPQIGWYMVDNSINDLVNYAPVRDAVLKSDPDYQKFLKWQETGELPDQEQAIDPATKELKDKLALFEKEKAAEKAQAEKLQAETIKKNTETEVTNYDNSRLSWLDKQIAAFNWGDENKDLTEKAKVVTQATFNADPKAVAALHHARRLHLQAKSNPKDTKIAGLLNSANKVVEHHLARHLKAFVEPINRLVGKQTSQRAATRQKQQGRPVIPNAGTQPAVLSGLSNIKDPYERALALADRARAEGRLSGYDGG